MAKLKPLVLQNPSDSPPASLTDIEKRHSTEALHTKLAGEKISTEDDPYQPDPTYAGDRAGIASAKEKAVELQIREMLAKGWALSRVALSSAEECYKVASQVGDDDPRLHYAYGLVLLKHYQYDDALKQFETAAKRVTPVYLPGSRVTIWMRFLRTDYEPALVELVTLIGDLRKFKPEPLPDRVQHETIAWAGRMMGFLEGPAKARDTEFLREQQEKELCSLLSDEERELYTLAKQAVMASYDTRAKLQEQTRAQTKKQQEKESTEAKARIAEEKSQLSDEEKQVQRSAAQWEDWLQKQLLGFDSQLAALDQEYSRVAALFRTISVSIASIDQEIASLRASISQATKDDPKSVAFNQSQIDQRTRERQYLVLQRSPLELQASTLQTNAAAVRQSRQGAVNQYQNATGKLYKETASLAAREKTLTREQKEASKPITGNSTHVRVLGNAATALRSYVDLNLESEKQRLLNSFVRP